MSMSFGSRWSLAIALALVLPLAGCGKAMPVVGQAKAVSAKHGAKHHAADYQSLIVQPEAGSSPIVRAIGGATRSVWLQIYMITDPAVIEALCQAAARGIEVRVLLEDSPYNPGNPNSALSGNKALAETLGERGVTVQWTNPQFNFTHAKTMIVDGDTAYVLTYNLTKAATESNREFGIINRSPSDVEELKRIFLADWNREAYRPTDPDLVVSPDNARWRILGLMEQARQELLVGVEVISDPEVLALLVAKRKAGVDVRVLVGGVKKVPANVPAFAYLAQNGVPVRSQSRPYLHAKFAIADHAVAYIGSINLSTNSLDENRELGLILDEHAAIHTLRDVWLADWQKAESYEAYQEKTLKSAR
jgi:phosphatidylserine/phosphatidylglycerophosphate/cardiolipin synthase-like enzyme